MQIDIRYVAKLARLKLSEPEQKKLAKQLSEILGYIEKLKELNVSSVKPMSHVFPLKNVFHQDKVEQSLPVNQVLSNAPAVSGDSFFSVPRIIE